MKTRSKRFLHAGAAAACLAGMAVAAAPALAVPASLNLRIEGETSTIFEGPVTSDGHVVRPATGQARLCDGTNGGANPQPGPTPTSTLDDGARLDTFGWDGEYFDDFSDYLVSRIGPDSANDSQFWGQYVNSEASQVGGCQEIVKTGDEVLWAYDAFSKERVLKLTRSDNGSHQSAGERKGHRRGQWGRGGRRDGARRSHGSRRRRIDHLLRSRGVPPEGRARRTRCARTLCRSASTRPAWSRAHRPTAAPRRCASRCRDSPATWGPREPLT